MNWLMWVGVAEVAFVSAIMLAGWAYQASKSDAQHTVDLLRDTNDPRLASFLEEFGEPSVTAWDMKSEWMPKRRLFFSVRV